MGVTINDGHMVLKITENAKKYALFTTADHEAYNDLPNHDVAEVIKFWVKKYKAHNKYQWNQTVANQYKSVAYAGPPPMAADNNDATYISALEDTVKQLATERDTAYSVTTKPTQPPGEALMASTLNNFCTHLMTEVKNEMKKVLAAATTAALTSSNTGGGRNNSGGKRKTRGELKLCPHCNKKGTHKPEDCFTLPANTAKKPANFIDGRYVKKE